MLFKKSDYQDKIINTSNERVVVSLKTLIDLAKPAATLKRQQFSIRAHQNGGYISRFKGRGMEFDETRLYQIGDDIRSIDWRVTARTGKTHTKIFREERERPVFISVDNRSTMQFATRGVFKSVLAAKLAALLAWTAQHYGDKIGGQRFSEVSCNEIKPQNGKHAVLQFLNSLVKPQLLGNKQITFEHALSRLGQHVRPGSIVYIISDFRGVNSSVETNLIKLSEHCDVVLIFVFDPLEQSLPSAGRYRFTDENRDILIDTSDYERMTRYQQQFLQRQQKLEKIAKKSGITLIKCSTVDDPLQRLK